MELYYIEMFGSYENAVYFPFWSKESAEKKLKELEEEDLKGKDNKWYDITKRNYELCKYEGEIIEFGYSE